MSHGGNADELPLVHFESCSSCEGASRASAVTSPSHNDVGQSGHSSDYYDRRIAIDCLLS